MPWLGVTVATSRLRVVDVHVDVEAHPRVRADVPLGVGHRVLAHVGVAARRDAEPLTEQPVGELPVERQGALDVGLEAEPELLGRRDAHEGVLPQGVAVVADDGDVAPVVEDPAEAPGLAEDGVVDELDLRDLHRVDQVGVEQPRARPGRALPRGAGRRTA